LVSLCATSEINDILILILWLFPIDKTFGLISPNTEADLLIVLDMMGILRRQHILASA